MNKQILAELLKEQLSDALVAQTSYLPRVLSLESMMESQEIVIVTGVRRCGKSSLLKQLLRTHALQQSVMYIDFDDPRFEAFRAPDFEKVYSIWSETNGQYAPRLAIFDEIQNVEGWEKWMNFFASQKRFNVFISGSNSKMLSSELATRLTGRHRDVTLFPLSFREVVADRLPQFLDRSTAKARAIFTLEERAQLYKLFMDYVAYGGFPRVWQSRDRGLLSEYYADILNRDIIRRHKIRNQRQLLSFGLAVMSDLGRKFNKSKLADVVELKQVNSINRYFSHFAECYLGFELRKFDTSVRRTLRNPIKFYGIDHALARRVTTNLESKDTFYLENLVFIELLRHGHRIFYWQEGDGPEIDFVVEDQEGHRSLIQVSWSVDDATTRKREMVAFDAFSKRFPRLPVHDRLIITAELTPAVDTPRGVRILPFAEWALADNI